MASSAETQVDISKFKPWNGAFMVPIELLVGPEWNVNEMPPAMFNELVEEIDKNEFDSPLQVVPIPGKNLFLVIGGDHRLEALRALGWTEVPCCLKSKLDPADEDELKAYSVRRNNLHGEPNPEKLAVLESYLSQKWKKSQSAVRRRLLLRSQRLRAKINEAVKSDKPSGGQASGPVPSSGKDTLEDKDSGPQNKPFIPHKKKDPEEAKASVAKAVSLADKHKMRANVSSLAKILIANCENPDDLERGFAFFGHGGKPHLVVEMTPGLTKQVKALVKKLKADNGTINEFLEATLEKALADLPKGGPSGSNKKTKAKLPTSKKTSAKAVA